MSTARPTDAELLRLIDEHDEDCSTWEADFIESCMQWLDTKGPLTPKQRAKAEEILARLDGAP